MGTKIQASFTLSDVHIAGGRVRWARESSLLSFTHSLELTVLFSHWALLPWWPSQCNLSLPQFPHLQSKVTTIHLGGHKTTSVYVPHTGCHWGALLTFQESCLPKWMMSKGRGLFEVGFFIIIIHLFWLCWVVFVVLGSPSLRWAGAPFQRWYRGCSLWWLLLSQSIDSRARGLSICSSQAPEPRFHSCGAQFELPHSL